MSERPVTPAGDLNDAETERLTRRGLRLAQFTVAYNVVEGVVAVTAGLLAGLVSLVGFGIDSGIESAASVLSGSAWPPASATVRPTRRRNAERSRPSRSHSSCSQPT
jgi:hypothetical protein